MDRPNPKTHRLAIGALCLLLAIALYVLSIGPVALAINHRLIPQEPAIVVYAPLNWLVARSDSLTRIAYWYYRLWFVAGMLALAVYVASHLATVRPTTAWQPLYVDKYELTAEYRIGGPMARWMFWPANQLDRRIRPETWVQSA